MNWIYRLVKTNLPGTDDPVRCINPSDFDKANSRSRTNALSTSDFVLGLWKCCCLTIWTNSCTSLRKTRSSLTLAACSESRRHFLAYPQKETLSLGNDNSSFCLRLGLTTMFFFLRAIWREFTVRYENYPCSSQGQKNSFADKGIALTGEISCIKINTCYSPVALILRELDPKSILNLSLTT